jgi:hypothetical protein
MAKLDESQQAQQPDKDNENQYRATSQNPNNNQEENKDGRASSMKNEEVFGWEDPKKIAQYLKEEAENNPENENSPLQSAMSRLTMYIQEEGAKINQKRKEVLDYVKDELHSLFNKD